MSFQLKYHFKRNNTVVIAHGQGGNIRADGDTDDALSNGQKGNYAQWRCELAGGNVKCAHYSLFFNVLLPLT